MSHAIVISVLVVCEYQPKLKWWHNVSILVQQVEKEKEGLRMELNKAKQQMKETEQAIAAQQAELDKLNHIINEADHERVRQKKEYDIVINERDILGTECSR